MNILADDTLRRLAARYIRRQIRQLTRQIEGIRLAEDIEYIHQARVASRRLRTALAVFAELFGADRAQGWRKAIGKAARGLGDARDKDVQVEFLCEISAHADDKVLASGLARVLVAWEKKRENVQPQVLKSLKRLLASRVLQNILTECKHLIPKASKRDDGQPTPRRPRASEAIYRHALEYAQRRFDELRAFEPCLADPGAVQQHHAMRIATKRLRYTLEIYKSAYGEDLPRILEPIKQVQTFLGDIHDCDVWVEQLNKFLERQSRQILARFGHAGPLARLRPGIEYLCENRRAHRCQLFAEVGRYWNQLTAQGFWEEMLRTVRAEGISRTAVPGDVPPEEPVAAD